jgi:hypothetical protein
MIGRLTFWIRAFSYSTILFIATMAAAYGQTAFVPFVEMKIGGLIGGVENGRWVSLQRAAKLMKEQTEFVLIGRNGVEEGGVTLGKLIQPTANEPCDDFYAVETELDRPIGLPTVEVVGQDRDYFSRHCRLLPVCGGMCPKSDLSPPESATICVPFIRRVAIPLPSKTVNRGG